MVSLLSIIYWGDIIERLGGVTEWLKVPLSKSGVALRLPWVRIPPPPLLKIEIELNNTHMERCWSGRSGSPGERVYLYGTVGSNPTLSVLPSMLKVRIVEKIRGANAGNSHHRGSVGG